MPAQGKSGVFPGFPLPSSYTVSVSKMPMYPFVDPLFAAVHLLFARSNADMGEKVPKWQHFGRTNGRNSCQFRYPWDTAWARALFLAGEPLLAADPLPFANSNADMGEMVPKWQHFGRTKGRNSCQFRYPWDTACARAQSLAGEPLLAAAISFSPARMRIWERWCRSGNTSGAPKVAAFASSATGPRKLLVIRADKTDLTCCSPTERQTSGVTSSAPQARESCHDPFTKKEAPWVS